MSFCINLAEREMLDREVITVKTAAAAAALLPRITKVKTKLINNIRLLQLHARELGKHIVQSGIR